MAQVNDPIRIGNITVKNRMTFAPTVKFDYTDDSGCVTDRHVAHYEERAKGGVGLICVEATAVTPNGRFCKTHMGLWNDEQMEGHKRITEACHRWGSTAILQLNHTGYMSNPECGRPIGPSVVTMDHGRGTYQTVAMSLVDIAIMQDAFVEAAVRAQEAGYDGIQLHGCHSYLLNQFMSPAYNQRRDIYGGSTENRSRFCVEIIRRIREMCGQNFLISVRTSGCDDTVEEAIAVAEQYVAAGCDYLQVSSGLTSLDSLPDHEDPQIGKVVSLGVAFHEHFRNRVPVSAVGNIFTPELVKYLIEKDYVDTVDLARAILADPEFTNAVLENGPYTKCFVCKACQYGPFTAHKCPAEILRRKG